MRSQFPPADKPRTPPQQSPAPATEPSVAAPGDDIQHWAQTWAERFRREAVPGAGTHESDDPRGDKEPGASSSLQSRLLL